MIMIPQIENPMGFQELVLLYYFSLKHLKH